MRTILKLLASSSSVIMLLIIGTIAYHNLEGWRYTDSFYFTGVTLATVGYGDFVPTHDISKIFTVFFAFAGVGIVLVTMTSFAESYFESRQKKSNETLEKDFVAIIRDRINSKKSK
jgi:hypothetical protein